MCCTEEENFSVAAWWTAVLPQTLLRCSVWTQRYEGRCKFVTYLSSIYSTFTVSIFAALAMMSRHGVLLCFSCVDEVISSPGVNTGGVGSYIYDDPAAETQPWGDKPPADGCKLQSVCWICIFFIQIFFFFFNLSGVHFWFASSWFCLPNLEHYRLSLIITTEESSWF